MLSIIPTHQIEHEFPRTDALIHPHQVPYDYQLLNVTVYQPTDHTYHLEQIFF